MSWATFWAILEDLGRFFTKTSGRPVCMYVVCVAVTYLEVHVLVFWQRRRRNALASWIRSQARASANVETRFNMGDLNCNNNTYYYYKHTFYLGV
jgi:hypothetical protein